VRLDLLRRLPDFEFVVTPDVLNEIVLPDQKQHVENAVAAGILRVEGLSSPDSLTVFAELRRLMGAGEAASLALAVTRGWVVASDEKKAFRTEALARLGPGRILTTPGLYVLAIRSGVLSVEEADGDRVRLEACMLVQDGLPEFSGFGLGGTPKGPASVIAVGDDNGNPNNVHQ